jgi:hypothetical protein
MFSSSAARFTRSATGAISALAFATAWGWAHAQPAKTPAEAPATTEQAEPFPISLKIRNTSLFPVAVDIPGLMQANFLPLSTSGASVPVGQELYFKFEGERTLLTRIEGTERVQEIVINEVVAKRRAALQNARRAAQTDQ